MSELWCPAARPKKKSSQARRLGVGEPAQCLADLRDEFDFLAHQARLVQIGLAIVGREVLLGELGGQVHHRVDRLPRVV
mgnify:CR=1 FL=1